MDTHIRPIPSLSTLQGGAVRRIAPRRGGSQGQSFSEELERGPETRREGDEAAGPRHEELPVAPPEGDETGTRIDLVG